MSNQTCGPLCVCTARGACTKLDANEAKRARIENAKYALERFKRLGQTIDGRTPTLHDLIGDLADDAGEDKLADAQARCWASYGARR